MRLSALILWVLLVAGISGCEKKPDANTTARAETGKNANAEVADAPKLDLTTPEKAIYSYQALKNWELAALQSVTSSLTRQYNKKLTEATSKIDTHVFNAFTERSVSILKDNDRRAYSYYSDKVIRQYEFVIQEMKKETDTRVVAIVHVKNSTPIKSDISLDYFDKKRREEGALYKFELELDKGRWLISQLSQFDRNSSKWEPAIKKMELTTSPDLYYYVSLVRE